MFYKNALWNRCKTNTKKIYDVYIFQRLWWNAYWLTSNEMMPWSVNPTTWNKSILASARIRWRKMLNSLCVCMFCSFPSMTNTNINVNHWECTCVKHECAHINIKHCVCVCNFKMKFFLQNSIKLLFTLRHVHNTDTK